jgi:hypothetical protein
MNRANQNVLFQQTNQGLLSIRQAELNYYVSLNIAFGTQAALIGGFTYGVFTQNQVNDDNSYSDIFQDVYWVTSAGTIACAVFVIITTMSVQVLGPGLALHGPVGSMARAAEGMRIEQQPVIYGFVLMMILFSLSTILSFWAVMSFYAAIGATAVYVIAARYWYYYSERIYLRFYWNVADSQYATSDDGDNPAANLPPDLANNGENYGERTISKSPADPYGVDFTKDSSLGSANGEIKKKRGGIKIPRLLKKSNKELTENLLTNKIENTRGNASPGKTTVTSSNKYDIAMEGYLLKKGSNNVLADFNKEPWERRYFTLNYHGQLFVYKARQDYRLKPKQPLYNRPINLHEFLIEIYNSEDPYSIRTVSVESSQTGYIDDSSSVAGGSGKKVNTGKGEKKLRFQLTLIPLENIHSQDKKSARQNWILRCDTEEELEIWTAIMRDISPESFQIDE